MFEPGTPSDSGVDIGTHHGEDARGTEGDEEGINITCRAPVNRTLGNEAELMPTAPGGGSPCRPASPIVSPGQTTQVRHPRGWLGGAGVQSGNNSCKVAIIVGTLSLTK
jgi:hypothetical protein